MKYILEMYGWHGKIGRMRFFLSIFVYLPLIVSVVSIIILMLGSRITTLDITSEEMSIVIAVILLVYGCVCAAMHRFRDLGMPWYLGITILIPVFGVFVMIYLFFAPSKKEKLEDSDHLNIVK